MLVSTALLRSRAVPCLAAKGDRRSLSSEDAPNLSWATQGGVSLATRLGLGYAMPMPVAISILLLLAALVSGAAAEMLDQTTAAAHAELLSPEILAHYTAGE